MDFKSLRSDKLKLTQEEFANLYGISIQEVQELDKTGKPDMDLIVKIATKSGLDFNTILSYEKPRVKPISAKDTWEKTNFTKKSLSGYLNSALEQMDIPDDMRKNYIDDLEIGIMSKFVKPTVAIVGRSDTGKSTLINSLIGAEKMPAKWTPTTSTAVYVKHIKDRPAFIHDEAWIFKRECGNEKFWNSKRLYDEKYCEKWKVAGGDLSLLETYSTRQGGGLKTEAGSAVVFVDAPILLNCDIIDLPGYGTETASDDVITAKTAAHADVLIYLSLASGFLRIEDIEYLKNNVRTLPVLEKKGENGLKPLANLFVVASHADSVDNGNEISLANILKSGCERYMSTLSDSYWKSRAEESGYDYSPAVIQSRFFTYTTDIPALCEKFRNNLEAVLETIPEIVDTECKESVRAYVARKEPNLEAEIQKYEALVEDRQKYVELLKDIQDSDLERTAENDNKKREIKDLIHSLNGESLNECTKYCTSVLTVDEITRRIKSKGIKNKKEDIQQFASQLQDEMQSKCSDLLKERSEQLSVKVKEYVSDYQEGVQASFQEANLNADFDAGYEENADLTDDIINDIHVYHNRLGAVVTDIAQLEQEEYEKQKRAIEATNTTQIKKLYTIKQKLENAKTHAEFDKLLQEISAVDAEIDHDNLTSEQKTHYDQLNKSCTDTISAKMRQLEYKDNIDYNKKAVNAYNSAFTSFKNNESRYTDKSQLFGLVSTTLFAYDAGRLFNETLIFYNHVYSYIFSKLDDNGKLELTRYSIECERKLR